MRTSAVSTLVSTVFLLPGLLTSACSHMEGAGRQALTSHKLLTTKTFKSQVVWCSAKESNCHCTTLFSGFWATIWPKCSNRVASSVSDWNHLWEVRLFSYPQLQPRLWGCDSARSRRVFGFFFSRTAALDLCAGQHLEVDGRQSVDLVFVCFMFPPVHVCRFTPRNSIRGHWGWQSWPQAWKVLYLSYSTKYACHMIVHSVGAIAEVVSALDTWFISNLWG